MSQHAPRSTEFLSSVLDSIPAIVWTADPVTFRFTWVSRGAESILGYPIERWLESPQFWRDRIHPDDRWVIPMYQSRSVLEHGDQLVYRMIAANGRIVWFRDRVHVCTHENEAIELCGVMLDVTAEHEAHEALAQSEQNYRRLVHTAPDGIAVHTRGRFVFANPKFVEIFGASHESEIVGREILTFVDPAYREVVRNRLAQIAIGDNVPMTREKLIRIDGTPFDAEVLAIPVMFNGTRAVQTVVRDVTERIRNEERLEMLATGTNEAIWEGDPRTNDFWTNECFKTMFGPSPDFASGRRAWEERIHPEDRERVLQTTRSESWSDEYRIRKSDGSYIWVLDRGHRVLDRDGRELRVIGALLDVTPFRR